MDFEAFEADVWQSVNESLYAYQTGSLDDSDPDSGFTGHVLTIGETWLGALYGTTENYDGTRRAYLFDTEREQHEWYATMAFVMDAYPEMPCPCGDEDIPEDDLWGECGLRRPGL